MGEKPFTIRQTWLECINPDCGYKKDLLKERKFRCPKCGNLYDVNHNYDLLKMNTDDYCLIFDARANSSGAGKTDDPKRKSGIWRYKEWIMPFLPDEYIVSLGEGNVPIVQAGKHLMNWINKDIALYIILEGMTPTGSFKDYGGTVMMSVAKAIGIKAIGCASTGDTSAMAAAYAAAAGIKCFVILPAGKITPVQLAQPLVHGAIVITLPGNFDDCMKVMQELVSKYKAFPANSLNPTRIEGHQATVFQIAQHFGWEMPDWIALPVGNGSNCSSVGKALRLLNSYNLSSTIRPRLSFPHTRILGCQSRAANPLARAWNMAQGENYKPQMEIQKKWENAYEPIKVGITTATAASIGNPVSCKKVMREIILSHGAMQVSQENELNEAVAVCGKDGHFVCPQTGIALAGVRNAAKKGWIRKGEFVVVVSTATGLKFTESAADHLKENIVAAPDCRTETVADILEL